MGKRKNPQAELVTWTHEMDDALIDAFQHQMNIGNRVTGNFTSKAYGNILKELSDKFKDVSFDKEKIKNRIKYLKRNFGACYDIFKNLSGFAWNSVTHTWCAEPEVWKTLLEAHPEARPWMNKPVRNYKKLESLFGNDRATEETADTAAEIRERNAHLNDGESEVQVGGSIEEIDLLVSENRATLGGYDVDPESPLLNKTGEEKNSSKKRQKTRKSKDEEIVNLNNKFDKFADAIKESTAELVKSQQRLQIPESDICNYLEELQLDEEVKNAAYLHLIDVPSRLGAFLGCPSRSRRTILLKMLHNAGIN